MSSLWLGLASIAVVFMRSTKTGSTSVLLLLRHWPGCVRVRNHDGGCLRIDECNGTLQTDATVAPLRHPLDRYTSQEAHMRTKDRALLANRSLEEFLRPVTAGCDGEPACVVRAINAVYRKRSRVILWPQSLWIGPATRVVCVSRTNTSETMRRWQGVLEAVCPTTSLASRPHEALANARPHADLPRANESWVRDVYRRDVELWHRHCEPSGVG